MAGRVNDLAGLLPVGAKLKLEEDLHRFEQETTHQIVVLTVPGLEGDGIEDFSIRVADAWKVGQQGIANGVILLVAQKERMIRIEVGRGLEGILPDAIASRIIREAILPRYRNGDYAGSITAGVDSILDITRNETATKAPQTPLFGSLGALASGLGAWIVIALAGAFAVATAYLFAGKAGGRPMRNAPVRRNSWPRDTIHYSGTGDGGGWGSSDFGGGGFGGDFGGGFSGGGGDFGGGGASGGDGGGSGGD